MILENRGNNIYKMNVDSSVDEDADGYMEFPTNTKWDEMDMGNSFHEDTKCRNGFCIRTTCKNGACVTTEYKQ